MQLSFPPRRLHNENIVRTPELLPDVIRLSEFGDTDGETVAVDDLGVTADAEQLYLVHVPTGKRVAPRTLHALEVTVHPPPLARFLSEVADARSAVFAPFNFGAARTLPYTPRIRYRRTVLSPARWLLGCSDLATGRAAGGWEKSLRDWVDQWRVPARALRPAREQQWELQPAVLEPARRELPQAERRQPGKERRLQEQRGSQLWLAQLLAVHRAHRCRRRQNPCGRNRTRRGSRSRCRTGNRNRAGHGSARCGRRSRRNSFHPPERPRRPARTRRQ